MMLATGPAMCHQGSSAITPPRRENSASSISRDTGSMRVSKIGEKAEQDLVDCLDSAEINKEYEYNEEKMKMGLPDQAKIFKETSGCLPERKEVKSKAKIKRKQISRRNVKTPVLKTQTTNNDSACLLDHVISTE